MIAYDRYIKTTDLTASFLSANHRLFIIDYDGVLVTYNIHPGLTIPGRDVMSIIKSLCADPKNRVVLLTNREMEHLDRHWSELNITLVAENGAFYREPGKKWEKLIDYSTDWIEKVAPALNALPFQFEGTFVERKSSSITWHYGTAKQELADAELRQISAAIRAIGRFTDFSLHIGQQEMELSTKGVDAGSFIARWIGSVSFDFLFAIGEAQMDHTLFGLLPKDSFTVRVNPTHLSNARYNVKDQPEAVVLLAGIVELCRNSDN